jgi:predicted Zn finger-like uncharacterized protein
MILTCPSCSASYNVPSDAIGEEGRDVRCKKCQHTWFQKSEEGERLDHLIDRIQSEDIDEDDISFREAMAETAEKRRKQSEEVSVFQRIAAVLKIGKKSYVSTDSNGLLKHIASGMVAIATVSLFLFAFFALRVQVVGVVPALGPVYTQMGFAVSPYADINSEEALVIENSEIVDVGGRKMIKANLINLTSSAIRLPKIRVSYRGDDGGLVKEDKYILSQTAIGKEASALLMLPASNVPPEGVSLLEISFVD